MTRVLILLNSSRPSTSETFIRYHVDQIAITYINLYHFGKINNYFKSNHFVRKIQNKAIDILTYLKFRRTIKKNKINIVLAEYGMVGADAVHYCKLLKIPLVVHFHGHDAHRKKILKNYEAGYKKLFEYASAIIVVSLKMRNALIEIGAPAEKIKLNVYGVDIEKINSIKQTEKKMLQAFSVGRFVDKKAPYLLILAFEKVLNLFPAANLYIAGDGYLFEACQRIIDAKKLNKSIFLLGELNHEEVLKKMSESVVYVQHSVEAFDGDSEGTPNSILEASAIGLPIVATAHAGIQDIVNDGENGYLVIEGDIDTMSKKIIEIFSLPSLSKEIGENARKKIETNFTMDKSINNLKLILTDAYEKQR